MYHITPRTDTELGNVYEYTSPSGEVFEVTYASLRRCGFTERGARRFLKELIFLRADWGIRKKEAKVVRVKGRRGRPKGRKDTKPRQKGSGRGTPIETPDGYMTVTDWARIKGIGWARANHEIFMWRMTRR